MSGRATPTKRAEAFEIDAIGFFPFFRLDVFYFVLNVSNHSLINSMTLDWPNQTNGFSWNR